MRSSIVSLSLAAAALVPAFAAAADAPPVTGNMTIASDYRFRGISQTYLGPAVQAGIDYAHPSGVYVGNWNSNVASQVFLGGAGIEMDFYGGYKKSFGDFGVDVGTIYYWYPRAAINSNTVPGLTTGDADFNNWEIYLGASWKWLSAKLFYALSDYFGLGNEQANAGYWCARSTTPCTSLPARGSSDGSTYFDLTATYPVTKELSVVGHYGMLAVKSYDELDYKDWKLGVTYDLAGWILGAAYVDTDADDNWYYTAGSKGAKATGKSTVVLSVTKTF